ncbi:acetyltransferase, partial [Pseudomassariella vexata]
AIVVTEKCYIRPYEHSDATASQPAANDPEVSRFLRNRFPSPYTLENAHSFIKMAIEARPVVDFAVFKSDGTFAGGIGLTPGSDVTYRTYELGYWTGKDAWGQGITTSAVTGFCRWAFVAFPEMLRLEAEVCHENAASVRVLEKAGFIREGVKRQAYCKKGVVMDMIMFSMLRQD